MSTKSGCRNLYFNVDISTMVQPTREITQQLSTVRDYIRYVVSRMTKGNVYFGHGTDNALDEALVLVLHAVGIPLGQHDMLLDARLTDEEKKQVLAMTDARVIDRIPLPYLTGEAWFAGMPFVVNEQVLIPRSPIAELIEQGFQPWLGDTEVTRILDLCTGSGCIGIACAHYFDGAEVELSDVSAEALTVAQRNIDRYDLQRQVRTVVSDLFANLERPYDLIVSNPPYVDSEDYADMPAEYRHEPMLALTAGDDGLDIARRILVEAADYLSDGGLLVLEVGNSGVALDEAFPAVPFTWVEFERGGHGVLVMQKSDLLAYRSQFTA